MKKYSYGVALLACSMFATNCMKEDIAGTDSQDTVKFSVYTDVLTRTVADGLSTSWAESDAINVFHNDGSAMASCGKFEVTDIESGRFDGELPKELDGSKSYDWYAVYPYAESNVSPENLALTIADQVQKQTGNNSTAHMAGKNIPLYGKIPALAASVVPAFQMHHLSAMIKVSLTNGSGAPLVVKGIVVKASASQLSGTYTVNLTGDEPVLTPVKIAPALQTVSLNVEDGEAISSGETADFFLAVAPFAADVPEIVTIEVISSDHKGFTKSYEIPVGKGCPAGEMTTFRCTFADAVDYVDLSAAGSANCYIVPSAGKYRFTPARGNEVKALTGLSSATWLWQSKTADLVENVIYADGAVYFTAGSKEGNVLLGGYDGNVIAWSWHIWLTDDPRTSPVYSPDGNYQLLDRNLGAVSAEVNNYLSYGLYYQWGRKDPFIGANTTTFQNQESDAYVSSTEEHVFNEAAELRRAGDAIRFQLNGKNLTAGAEVEYLIENPLVYIYYHSDMGTTGGTNNWWKGAYADYSSLWAATKTIYDPCPAGYKVPATTAVFATSPTVSYDTTGNGVTYTVNGVQTYLPAAGARMNNGIGTKFVGAAGYYWSCENYSRNSNFRYLNVKAGTFNCNAKNAAAYGCSIRCVKE